MSRLRLYAVVRLKRRTARLPAGLARERLRLIDAGFAAAVVSEARAALEPTDSNLLEYDRVIRKLAAVSLAILPARFGVTAESAADLEAEIQDRAGILASALNLVTGSVQMTLRVPRRSVEKESRSLFASGRRYLESRVAASPENMPALSSLRHRAANIIKAERVEPGRAGATVYHLVARGEVTKYRSLAAGLRVTGPFAPYAFAPGIDHAFRMEYDPREDTSAEARPRRPRARRRSARNTR
jgi:Gas vesicle synthesis protein GvpL/GvpF